MQDKERYKMLRTDVELFLFSRDKRADKARQVEEIKSLELPYWEERKELDKIQKAFMKEGIFRDII